ncbi:MAG: acyl-CoA dehydrogenase family protein [Myxococcales bacterium]
MDPISQALSALNRFAGSELVHKLGLYEPATKLAHVATREGFRAVSNINRQFKSARKLVNPQRLPKVAKKSDLFDLSLTEEQEMIREMTQGFGRDVLREAAPAANDAAAAPAEVLDQMGELGLAQFAVPEALGGAATESSTVTQVLAIEQLCAGDMGLSVAGLAPVGVANALSRWGSTEQQEKYLQPFAEDRPPVAAHAVAERRPAFDPRELRTRARVDGEGYVLTGEKTLVPLVESAELLLVAAELVGRGPQLFLVETATEGVSVKAEPAMGIRAAGLGAVRFDEVRLPPGALLGGDVGIVDYEEAIDRAAIAWCAAAVGAGQAVLDYVIPYVNERKAFGEPISQRQAVAFMVANIGIELEGMRLLTYRAAARADQGLPFHREAYLARVLCTDKGMQIGTDGVQLLGGHGFTKEHPVERWYRDLRGIGVMEGGLFV